MSVAAPSIMFHTSQDLPHVEPVHHRPSHDAAYCRESTSPANVALLHAMPLIIFCCNVLEVGSSFSLMFFSSF